MSNNEVSISLVICCCSPNMPWNIISLYTLLAGFRFFFFLVMVFIKSVVFVGHTNNLMWDVGFSNPNVLDKSCLWHFQLRHMNQKRITKLKKDGILESSYLESNDVCESCLLGKMTKIPFVGNCERRNDLLDVIHTDVCRPFKSTTRHGKHYFMTFTDDFSRFGYIYLKKHKSETFEVFK